MQQILTIPRFTFPGLNEIIKASKAHPMAYSTMKRNCGNVVASYIRQAKLKPMKGPVAVSFEWIEKTGRRDPDNIRAGSKFILDALVKSKILPSDGQKAIAQLSDCFRVDKKVYGVTVHLFQEEEA